jgi:hypothetical protein
MVAAGFTKKWDIKNGFPFEVLQDVGEHIIMFKKKISNE